MLSIALFIITNIIIMLTHSSFVLLQLLQLFFRLLLILLWVLPWTARIFTLPWIYTNILGMWFIGIQMERRSGLQFGWLRNERIFLVGPIMGSIYWLIILLIWFWLTLIEELILILLFYVYSMSILVISYLKTLYTELTVIYLENRVWR